MVPIPSVGRVLEPTVVAIGGGVVHLVDGLLPVVVDVDIASRAVLRRRVWKVERGQEDRPTSVAVHGETVAVASPGWDGVVLLGLVGAATYVRLPRIAQVAEATRDGGFLALQEPYRADGLVPPERTGCWRVSTAGIAERLEFGGIVLAAADYSSTGTIAVVALPGDVPSAPRGGEGRVSYPASVVVLHAGRQAEVVARLEHAPRAALAGTGWGAWLQFERDLDDSPIFAVSEEGLQEQGPPLTHSFDVLLSPSAVWWYHLGPSFGSGVWARGVEIHRRFLSDERIATWRCRGEIEFAGASDNELCAVVEQPYAWSLLSVSADERTGRITPVVVDLSDLLPVLQEPEDVRSHEEASREEVVQAFGVAGIDGCMGTRSRRIPNLQVHDVAIVGKFPKTCIALLFSYGKKRRPKFGRAWRVWDDLGRPEDLGAIDLALEEHLEAAGMGLPSTRDAQPDRDGIVWF